MAIGPRAAALAEQIPLSTIGLIKRYSGIARQIRCRIAEVLSKGAGASISNEGQSSPPQALARVFFLGWPDFWVGIKWGLRRIFPAPRKSVGAFEK